MLGTFALPNHLGSLKAVYVGHIDVEQDHCKISGQQLPESLATSPVATKLEAVTSIEIPADVTLDELLEQSSSDVESVIEECESADLPKGFGRD
jgi:hypothetical protein